MRLKRRRYQTRCVDALKAALRAQQKRALIDMATGLGKTVTVGRFVKWFLKRKLGRVLFLCHQNDLVEQLEKKVKEVVGEEYSYGVFHSRKKPKGNVDILFASLQTMVNHKERFGKDAFALVVVDEAHHSSAETYGEAILYFDSLLTVGMTATSNEAIRQIYGKPIFRLPLERALAAGLLTPVRYSVYLDSTVSLDKVVEGRPARKLSIKELNARLFNEQTEDEIARIVAERMKEVPNAQAMVFASDIAQCERFSTALGSYMPDVSTVHYEVDNDERSQRLEHFREGKLRALTARDVLNEGIDVPAVTHVVFLRATNSMRIFLQQLGRALRRYEGKTEVYVLDFVGNCERLILVSELAKRIGIALSRRPKRGGSDREPFVLEDREAEVAPEFAHRVKDLLEILEVIRTAWTEETGLEALRQLYARLGRPVSIYDVHDGSRAGVCPSVGWLRRRFDPEGRSHIPALQKAGVPSMSSPVRTRSTRAPQKDWTEEDGLQAIRDLYARLNRPLATADISLAHKAGNCPSLGWLRKLDPDGRSPLPALKKAGVPARSRKRRRHFKKEGVLEAIRRIHATVKRPLEQKDLTGAATRGELPRFGKLVKMFDPEGASVLPALAEAGVPASELLNGWTEERGLQALRDLHARLGRPVTLADINRASKAGEGPSVTWVTRFDPHGRSHVPALEKAGVPAAGVRRAVWTEEEARRVLTDLQKRLDRPLSRDDIDRESRSGGCPTANWLIGHCKPDDGSVVTALTQLGIAAKKRRTRLKWTEETALQSLRDLAAKLGHKPKKPELAKATKEGLCPSMGWLCKTFGDGSHSLDPVMRKAGLL